MKFPILYHRGKNGSIHQWTIWTEGDTIITEHGQVNGAMQISPKKAEGKNLGRANETTPEEQAIKEARSMWTYKVERKYSETIEQAQEEVFLPMLAHSFKDTKKPGVYSKKATFPVDISSKLDGARSMAFWDGDRVYMGSRNGKEWSALKHISSELEKYLPKEMVLDGELYIHGVDFESIASWTKKLYPETSTLEYHVFDMPIDSNGNKNLPWKERYKNMVKFFKESPTDKVKLVPVLGQAKNTEEVLAWEEKCVNDGYEGAMVRNLDAAYLFGHRSHDLLKVKSSVDSEYEIVGFESGVGKFEKSVIWHCITKDRQEFKVVPKATQERREYYFANAKEYIGQYLKVRYQNLTKDGIPRFPRGLGIRDQKDM